MPDPTAPRLDVPDELMALARREWCAAEPARGGSFNVEDALRNVLAAVLPAARRQWFAELFGSPEEIAAREAEAGARTPDDTVRLCEMARPGEHEQRVRAKVAAEQAEWLPELVDIVNGFATRSRYVPADAVRVVRRVPDAVLEAAAERRKGR
ncbi:hypothetical protein [Actinomadura litoris]|uniref:hypothetical protein n=1 Tax=Actinomadura litoris TaxID=2678616 RepID=UPI001FA7FC52|nr:hypothetical protein [Actinomadura litoris]